MFKHPIDFVNEQCDKYYLHRLDRKLAEFMNHLVLSYLNSPKGDSWIFFNSDIQIFDDEGRYRYTIDGQVLDPDNFTIFVTTGYGYWEKRIKCPGLTPEEELTLLNPITEHMAKSGHKMPYEEFHLGLWAILIWHASPWPAAMEWRQAASYLYKRGLQGDFMACGKDLIPLDEVEMVEQQLPACTSCGSTKSCVTLTQPGNHYICAACLGSGECRLCDRVCKHNTNVVANQGIERYRFNWLSKKPKQPALLTPARGVSCL